MTKKILFALLVWLLVTGSTPEPPATCPVEPPAPDQQLSPDWLVRCAHCAPQVATATPMYRNCEVGGEITIQYAEYLKQEDQRPLTGEIEVAEDYYLVPFVFDLSSVPMVSGEICADFVGLGGDFSVFYQGSEIIDLLPDGSRYCASVEPGEPEWLVIEMKMYAPGGTYSIVPGSLTLNVEPGYCEGDTVIDIEPEEPQIGGYYAEPLAGFLYDAGGGFTCWSQERMNLPEDLHIAGSWAYGSGQWSYPNNFYRSFSGYVFTFQSSTGGVTWGFSGLLPENQQAYYQTMQEFAFAPAGVFPWDHNVLGYNHLNNFDSWGCINGTFQNGYILFYDENLVVEPEPKGDCAVYEYVDNTPVIDISNLLPVVEETICDYVLLPGQEEREIAGTVFGWPQVEMCISWVSMPVIDIMGFVVPLSLLILPFAVYVISLIVRW